jgi:hypothetical protein
MEPMKAIEVTGSVNEAGYVAFDRPIANAKPLRFRGILLLPDSIDLQDEEWSPSAISASVRDLLDDPEEDIYTLEDGEPIDAALPFSGDCKIAVVADETLVTTAEFASLTEAEIIQDNERRWQTFQQQGGGIPQNYVESWVENLGLHDSHEAAAVLAQFLADHQAKNKG